MDYLKIFLCMLFVSSIRASVSSSSTVVVHTKLGDIAGTTETIMADGSPKPVTQFTNVPYAESTAGQNRFLKPIAKAPFKDTFNAVGNPVGCIQSSQEATHRLSPFANFTEDCLILNIFVPHDFTKNVTLPVMIWIYGGGFAEGASSLYPPVVLVALTDVIVVTINYRLGMFGFLQSSDGKVPGNQGLWDQHLAIKWIHENIAPFTGDPNQVTIFGESAGSASVLYQAMYPGNHGYFHRVIAESGSPLADWAHMVQPNYEMFFKRKGCNTSDPIACLRAKTPDDLQLPRDVSDPLQFLPSVDGDFVPESVDKILLYKSSNPKSVAARDFFESLDLLTGVNNFDGVLYVIGVWPSLVGYKDINKPRITRDQLENIVFEDIVEFTLKPPNDQTRDIMKHLLINEYTNWNDPESFTSTRMSLANISNDAEFFFPATCITEAHATSNRSRTYFYEFVHTPSQHTLPTPTWIHGANHGDEVPMVLGKPLSNVTVSTEDDKYVSRAMTTMWTNFAKSGNVNTPQDVTRYIHTTWPEYNLITRQYFEISKSMTVTSIKQYFQQQRMTFWSEISN